jgi:D-sedoheptulose 7-phosphate isomerase
VKFIENYLAEIKMVIDNIDKQKICAIKDEIIGGYERDAAIFICGNGGSAATAAHFCNDLSKLTIKEGLEKRFRVISLVDNIPLITAWANDESYESIFVEQLKNLFRKGDLLIGISGSGNSRNVLRAVEFVNQNGGTTIGITGFDGGQLKHFAKISLVVPSNSMQQVEDIHLILEHLICSSILEKI